MAESLRDSLETEELWVRITNKPPSCCGVIQQGWEGRVAYLLECSGSSEDIHGDIVVLDDGTLAWDFNCEVINKPCLN